MSVVEQALRVLDGAGPDEIIAVVGPTASGKSALALELASRLGGELVGADSVQIYRWFDIGSGKPTPEERRLVPHHLVDTLDPLDPCDAAAWASRAADAIRAIRSRNRVPIVCGGTYLWIKALIYGLAPAPGANEAVRNRHRAVAERDGRPALHAQLAAVDPASATRLHPNDFVRVSRALEVFELTGKPMSAWQSEHGFATMAHRATSFAIEHPPEALRERIEARARDWLEHGWIEEVEALLARGYGDARAMASVGYAQVRAMLAGELSRDELLPAIIRATRVFARRQRTWMNQTRVVWLRP